MNKLLSILKSPNKSNEIINDCTPHYKRINDMLKRYVNLSCEYDSSVIINYIYFVYYI